MYGKFITALAFTLGTGTAALAQTATDPMPEGGSTEGFTMPQGWEGNIGATLFSDPATGTAHSQADIATNWGNLSADEQTIVRDHCATMSTDAGGATGMDGAATTAPSDGVGTTGESGEPDNTGTTGTGTNTADMGATPGETASIRAICDQVAGL